MRFENSFEVDAPVERVWDAVLDVERVAPTVPGAQVLERTGESSYKVGIKVKLGPMSMTYRGEVEITESDEARRRAVMKARAKETRGQGTADADVTMELTGDDGHTSGRILTEVQVSGKAASMGQGIMQDVAGRMVDTFAENLAEMLTGKEPEPVGAATEARPGTPAGEEPAPSGPGEPPPSREAADALDLGGLTGPVIAQRLRDPRVLAVVAAVLAFLLGRRSAR
jgi:uncharacterized protein